MPKSRYPLPARDLIADEFRRGRKYATRRPEGSGDWLMIYTDEGSGRYSSSQAVRDSQPGDVTLYAPGEAQNYRTSAETGKWHLLWVHFTPLPDWIELLGWPLAEPGVRWLTLGTGEVNDAFRAAMHRMIRLARRRIPCAMDLAANALEEALLWGKVAASKDRWLVMDVRVRRAMDFLGSHSREPFVLANVARHCGLSVSRLAALFKEETGLSPQRYWERNRMQHAARLLRVTSLSVSEVAEETGYADPFYFSNRFRQFAKASPTQYRQDHHRR